MDSTRAVKDGGGVGIGGSGDLVTGGGGGLGNPYMPSGPGQAGGGGGGGGGGMPQLPPVSLKQEPGQYGLTSL